MSSLDHCYYHAPELEPKRAASGRKGGKRGGRGRPVAELARLQKKLEELAEAVLSGDVDKGRAAVAGQLFSSAVKTISAGLKAREQEELEARLEALEDVLSQRRTG